MGVSTDKKTPFWIYSNYDGSYAEGENVFGYFKSSIYLDLSKKDVFTPNFSFGLSVKNKINKTIKPSFEELFSKVNYRFLQLFVGVKKRPYVFNKLSTTNGDFLYSNFSRSWPQISFSIPEYVNIPFTNKLLAVKLHYAEGLLLDKRYVKDTRIHHKSGYLRFSKNPKWNFEIGLQHYAMWGGNSTNTKIGKLPRSFDAYFDIVLAKDNSIYDPLSQTDALGQIDKNRLGNHLGMLDLRFFYELKKLILQFYRQVIFEDSSGRNLFNRDALMGIYIKSKHNNNTWIQSGLYEFYATRYQSGSMSGPKPYGGVWTGIDNYFNHGIYRSGWTNYGRVIGTPFFTPKNIGTITYGVKNNRITANHLGLSGFLFNKIPYRLMISYVQNFGTYSLPIDENQYSALLDMHVFKDKTPFNINLGIDADTDKYVGDKLGFYITISKTGGFFLMKLKYKISNKYIHLKEFIEKLPEKFDTIGKTIYKDRNTIKQIEIDSLNINIKSFKRPHWINRFVYVYFRKSKAERSFLYAVHLQNYSINTPSPLAFINTYKKGLLYKSFYISIHIGYDSTLREIFGENGQPINENIIRQFTRYTYFFLHRNNVNQLDYSPGNVLISKQKNGIHTFNLIDLNRINFKKVSYLNGLANFSKLWINKDVIRIIAAEYANINDKCREEAIKILEKIERKHKRKVLLKQRLKQKFGRNIDG